MCPLGAIHCCEHIVAIVPENFAWLSATFQEELLQLYSWYSVSILTQLLVGLHTLCSWDIPREKNHRCWGRGILEAIQRVRSFYLGTFHRGLSLKFLQCLYIDCRGLESCTHSVFSGLHTVDGLPRSFFFKAEAVCLKSATHNFTVLQIRTLVMINIEVPMKSKLGYNHRLFFNTDSTTKAWCSAQSNMTTKRLWVKHHMCSRTIPHSEQFQPQ